MMGGGGGGGVPPFFRDFIRLLFGQSLSVMGVGVPPFSVMKKSVENWPKNSVRGCS